MTARAVPRRRPASNGGRPGVGSQTHDGAPPAFPGPRIDERIITSIPRVRVLLPFRFVAHEFLRRVGECLIVSTAIFAALALSATPSQDGLFEPSDIATVRGEVARVETLPRAGGGREVTLLLRTEIGDEVPVALAPRRVLKAMGLRLNDGDDIQVAGWRIVRGKPALLAAEINKGGRLFVFRDRHGVAVWSARRRLERAPSHHVD